MRSSGSISADVGDQFTTNMDSPSNSSHNSRDNEGYEVNEHGLIRSKPAADKEHNSRVGRKANHTRRGVLMVDQKQNDDVGSITEEFLSPRKLFSPNDTSGVIGIDARSESIRKLKEKKRRTENLVFSSKGVGSSSNSNSNSRRGLGDIASSAIYVPNHQPLSQAELLGIRGVDWGSFEGQHPYENYASLRQVTKNNNGDEEDTKDPLDTPWACEKSLSFNQEDALHTNIQSSKTASITNGDAESTNHGDIQSTPRGKNNDEGEHWWKCEQKFWIIIVVSLTVVVISSIVVLGFALPRIPNDIAGAAVAEPVAPPSPFMVPILTKPPSPAPTMFPSQTPSPTSSLVPTTIREAEDLNVACEWIGIPDTESCQNVRFVTTGTGSIPTQIGLLTQLVFLSLFRNGLTGTIPSAMASLTQLTWLDLSSNELTGTIPPQLASLTGLTKLWLGRNAYSKGTLPASFGDLTQLDRLNLYNSSLSGTIPSTLAQLTQLVALDLSSNALTGQIPSSVLGNLTDLTELYLSANALMGTIPSTVTHLKQLKGLRLNNNGLTGTVPESLADQERLTALYLYSNALTGNLPSALCFFVAPRIDCDEVSCSCCMDENSQSC